MWRAGCDARPSAALAFGGMSIGGTSTGVSTPPRSCEAGFTLMEILIVMLMVAMATTAVTAVYRAPSSGVKVKTAAMMVASRLRDVRASAMAAGRERQVEIDPNARVLRSSDGRAPLQLNPSLNIAVTAADSERTSPQNAGIRFYPNGSSSGATINLNSERQSYEVRVNWLTGRVSASARP